MTNTTNDIKKLTDFLDKCGANNKQTTENKMNNLSAEARELMNDLYEKGHSPFEIKAAMEDGVYLAEAGISEELADEVYFFLSEPHIYEAIERYHEERKMEPTLAEVPSLKSFLNSTNF